MFVLSRTNLADSSRRRIPNPRFLILLQTLCRSQEHQLLWNQANPNSFAKTPGVGCTSQKPSRKITNLQTLSSGPVCKSVTPPPDSPRSTLPGVTFLPALSFHNVTNCSSHTIDFHHLYFHGLTNCFFRNPFIFTTICVAPCFSGTFVRSPPQRAGATEGRVAEEIFAYEQK